MTAKMGPDSFLFQNREREIRLVKIHQKAKTEKE